MRGRDIRLDSFDVVVCDQGTTRTVTPQGDVDIATVDAVRRPLNQGLDDGFEHVVLDLGQTTFLDSTGVCLVLEASSRAEARDKRFVLLPGPPEVQRVFELCGFTIGEGS